MRKLKLKKSKFQKTANIKIIKYFCSKVQKNKNNNKKKIN